MKQHLASEAGYHLQILKVGFEESVNTMKQQFETQIKVVHWQHEQLTPF